MNKAVYPFHKSQNGKLKPKIPIRVVNFDTGEKVSTLAMIDTGADACTFPSMITLTIGHKLDDVSLREKGTVGVSGVEIDTYVHGYKIEVLDNTRKTVVRELAITGNTIITNTLVPILGTHMFLENFRVTLDYINNTIILEW